MKSFACSFVLDRRMARMRNVRGRKVGEGMASWLHLFYSFMHSHISLLFAFRLLSVYKHVEERRGRNLKEVTTHHGKGQSTVDYIFFSVKVSSRK